MIRKGEGPLAFVAVVACLAGTLVACGRAEPLPPPVQFRSPEDPMAKWVAPERVCPGESPDLVEVQAMIGWLGAPDDQAVQFAFDALREIVRTNPAARSTVVCYLDDLRPLGSTHLLVLNRGSQRFELVAHYTPRRVFDALALVIGSPPTLPAACFARPPETEADPKRCRDAWYWYLDQSAR